MCMLLIRFKVKILLLLLVCAPSLIYSQSYLKKENNIWLNNGEGIDFQGGTPNALLSSWESYDLSKGSATVCDARGNLLFYTDGNIVWNRNNDIMAHGWDINNNGNLAAGTCFIEPVFGLSSYNFDGVVIMPLPGSSHKYYVFSVPLIWNINSINMYENVWQGKLYASIVDMEANNGLGAVDSNFRGKVISEEMAGNLHAVLGEDCNYWLLGFGSTGIYKAFNITSGGIDTVAVTSTLTLPLNPYVSELTLSPDRKKMAMALSNEVQVADFDPVTGSFTNDFSIAAQDCRYAAFAPNSTLLYLSGLVGIRQFDLASLTFNLLTFNNITAFEHDAPLRLAPNNKIYLSHGTADMVSGNYCVPAHIQQPDVFGTGCQMALINQPLPLLENDWVLDYMFPNEVPVRSYDTVSKVTDAALCFNKPVVLNPGASSGTDFHWMVNTVGNTFVRKGSDSTGTLSATVPGTYAVQYFTSNPCLLHRDTFIVKAVSFSLYLGGEKISCDGDAVQLELNIPGATYLWPDGSTERRYRTDTSVNCWVQVSKDGCTASDTAKITIMDIHQNLGKDTIVCFEDEDLQVRLAANFPEGSSALWNTGSTDPVIETRDTGLFWVTVTNKHCMGTDSIVIRKQYCDCPLLFPNAFSPNNDGLNDVFLPVLPGECPVASFKLQVYNRWGQMMFVSYRSTEGWNGYYNGLPADAGTYMYRLEMKTGLNKKAMVKSGDFVLIR